MFEKIFLATRGQIRPKKEMTPKKEMQVAVIKEERPKRMKRSISVLTPVVFAISSPKHKALS